MARLVILNKSAKHAPPAGTLDAITNAIDEQLHALAKRWGEYVWQVVDDAKRVGFYIALLDSPDVADALGYHDVGPDGKPYARVFLDPIFDHAGSWTFGALSVSAVISHEVCELVGDPGANRWANSADGQMWALELCDAVESDWYRASNGVSVSNFLLPAYFNPFGTAPFDEMRNLTKPFEVGRGGYAITMESGTIAQVFGEDYDDTRLVSKVAGSRTQARINWETPL